MFHLALFSCKYQYLITKLGPNKRIRWKLQLQHEKYKYVIDNSFARMHIFPHIFYTCDSVNAVLEVISIMIWFWTYGVAMIWQKKSLIGVFWKL